MFKKISPYLLISHLINKIHFKIFNHSIGSEMQKFIKNLGWMSFGVTVGSIFLFLTNLFAGRFLGPIEYGKYALIISLGQFFIIPMTLGINTASVKYIASYKKKNKKKSFTQNTIFLSIIFTLSTSIICLIFGSQISKLFKINNEIFVFILIYSIFLSFKYISEAIIKGFHQFKLLSSLEFINSFVIFLSFFTYIFLFKKYSFQSYIIPVIIGLLIYSIIFINKNYQKIKSFKINKKIIKKILDYGKFATLGSISGIAIGNIDKLILNKYTSFSDIGIYSIYLSSSTFIGNYILQIFVQVFFPTVSSLKEKNQIVNKILKLMVLTAIPIVLINICSTSIILFLIGNKYEKNLSYILLFSILSMLNIFSNIFWWLINSFGKKGIKFTSTISIYIGIFNIIIMSLLTQKIGIIGTVYASILINTIMIIIAILKIRLSLRQNIN